MGKSSLLVVLAGAAAATSACSPIGGNILGGGPTYTGPPPPTASTRSGEAIHWELLTGHLAWSRFDALFVADADTKKLTRLSQAGATGYWAGAIALSPDATRIAFTAILNPTWPYREFVSSVAGGNTSPLFSLDENPGVAWPAWTPDGRAIVLDISNPFTDIKTPAGITSQLSSVPLDGGTPTPLPVTGAFGSGPVAISADGSAFGVALSDGIYVVGNDGQNLRRLVQSPPGRVLYSPTFSPDGTQLAFVSRHGPNEGDNGEPTQFQIFKTDLQGAASAIVTFMFSGYPCDTYVSWGPGAKIAFNKCAEDPDGGVHVYIADAMTGESAPLTSGKVIETGVSWVP